MQILGVMELGIVGAKLIEFGYVRGREGVLLGAVPGEPASGSDPGVPVRPGEPEPVAAWSDAGAALAVARPDGEAGACAEREDV